MKHQHLIELLNSSNPYYQNIALTFIDKEMKQAVLERTRPFVHIDKDEIWNTALTTLWTYVKKKPFEHRCEGSLPRFLCKICNWLIIRKYRKESRYTTLEISFLAAFPDDFNVEKALYEIQLLELVRRSLLTHLNEIEVEILVNKFYLGMSYEEMAKTLNKSKDVLKTTKYRAVNKLKKTLSQNDDFRNYLSQLLYRRKAVA